MKIPLIAAALALFVVACSVGDAGQREISVTALDSNNGKMSFDPAIVTVKAGEQVTFVVKNGGRIDHEFESDEAGIEEVIAPPGRTRRVSWQAPTTPGAFPVYCDIPGHREAGMELTLVVEE